MDRQLEPELMEQAEQVKAYAEADFEEPHRRFIELLLQHFNNSGFDGSALDLGCGPGDITRRFAAAFPNAHIYAIDGSKAMLDYAKLLLPKELARRIEFIHAKLPVIQLPQSGYSVIFSNSLLHHLPDPQILWNTIKQFAVPGAFVAVMDLLRPTNSTEAQHLVDLYATDEPDILRNDFYASLLAAFELHEIATQLHDAALPFALEPIGDRHVFISGFMPS